MDFDPNILVQKLRAMAQFAPIMALPTILRDSETGQINWSHIITGALTAGLISLGTAAIRMNNELAELRVITSQNKQYIDMLPVIATRQAEDREKISKLEEGRVTATRENLRRSDAEQLRAEMERFMRLESSRIQDRVDQLQPNRGIRR